MGLAIVIDGIYMVSPQPGGYRTYTSNLVNALAQCAETHDFRLLVDRESSLALPSNWRIDSLPRTGSFGFIWREQVSLPRYLRDENPDILHAPGATAPLRRSVPLVATLYDTIEFTDALPSIRHTRRWAMRLYSRLVQAQTAQIATRVITISSYSKQRIVERFGVSPTKVAVTYLAPASVFSTSTNISTNNEICRRAGGKNYILGIASAAPRKNTETLLMAYSRLPKALRQKHPLALVCTHVGVIKKVKAKAAILALEDQVHLLQNVEDKELAQLYRSAGVFVFPSLEEGFGLPPLEAMSCGAPVVASNTSSMPEVLGDAALLINPTDVDALATSIEEVLTNQSLADSLRNQGLMRCQQFSWEKTARQTLAVYESVGAR